MRNRLDEAKSELLAKAATVADHHGQRGHPRAEDEAFLRRYYLHVAPEDLVDRDPVDVFGAAASHRHFGQMRPQGRSLVRVSTPTVEEHGWSSGHTVVEVVTDDMPFLVDSVTMALMRQERGVHLVVHPTFVVRRDVTGRLLEISDYGEADPRLSETPDAVVESWMHVEIDRQSKAADQQRIADELERVLRDVRDAVEDWPRIRQRAEDIAAELEKNQLPVEADEVAESQELLRWLADDHFTFLGYREYMLDTVDGDDVLRAVTGSGLGILRADQELSGSFAKLPPEVRAKAREKRLLVLTKANSRATVHRPAYLDYVGVKTFDASGEVVGERRFLGLLTSGAYTESVLRIPVLRRRVQQVLEQSGFAATGHSGKDLMQVLETYPRDELFQTPADELLPIALAVVHLQERRQLRLFVRRDIYGRYLSCLVFLPRDRYNTDVRERFQQILLESTDGLSIDHTALVSESLLARLHFVIRMRPNQVLPDLDVPALEKRLVAATRAWSDDFADTLADGVGEEAAARLLRRYREAFPEAYKEDFPARTAVADVRRLEELPDDDGLGMNLYQPIGGEADERRFKIYRTGTPISLTQVLPILSRMGVEVVDERPYEILRDGDGTAAPAFVYDFGLRSVGRRVVVDTGDLKELFQDAFSAVWRGDAESDGFNALVLRARLSWRQAAVLRAYAKYLRQAGSTFSQEYLEECLGTHVEIARLLVDLFETRFDPDRFAGDPDARAAAAEEVAARLETALDQVASLDQDRILRAFVALVRATLRTNYYRVGDGGLSSAATSFKLELADLARPARAQAAVRGVGVLAATSKESTCASVPSPAAACAGPTGARTSGRRCSAWSRHRRSRTLSSSRSARRAASSASGFPIRPTGRSGWPRASAATRRSFAVCSTSPTTALPTAASSRPGESCGTTATTPTWSWPPTRAPRRSPTSPTRSPGSTASGSATPSHPAARPATTTRRWASPPAGHGSRSSGISVRWGATARARTSPASASATCPVTSSATGCSCPSTPAWWPRSTTGTSSSTRIPTPPRRTRSAAVCSTCFARAGPTTTLR